MDMGDEYISRIVESLKEEISPYLIVIFGSCAKGMSRDDSDIDLAYLSDRSYSSYEKFMVAQKLAGLLDREIDLLDLNIASTVMKAQIISSGQVLYCKDELRRMYFYMRAYKEYALLNEERAIILQDIERRGSVYGE